MQAKDQLPLIRAASVAAHFVLLTAIFILSASQSAEGKDTPRVNGLVRVTPLATLEPGVVVVSSAREAANCSFEKAIGRVESPAEGAGEAVATVLKTPTLGNPQLEAAVGVVQFAFTPFAAGYGAITAGHRKLTTEQL